MQLLRRKLQSVWVSVMHKLAAPLTLPGVKKTQTLISSNSVKELFGKTLSELIYSLIKWTIISIIGVNCLHCQKSRSLSCKLMSQTDNQVCCMWEHIICSHIGYAVRKSDTFWVVLTCSWIKSNFPYSLESPCLTQTFLNSSFYRWGSNTKTKKTDLCMFGFHVTRSVEARSINGFIKVQGRNWGRLYQVTNWTLWSR